MMTRAAWIMGSLVFIVACGKKPSPAPVSPPASIQTAKPADLRMDAQQRLVDRKTGDLFTGVLKEEHAPGTPRAEVAFQDGVRHGASREWHVNGHIMLEGTWVSGQPDGLIKEWSEDGLIRRDTVYEQGRQVSQREGPSEQAAAQVNQIVAQRKELDETIWKDEELAQQYEEVFVKLWDDLRAAKHDWTVLETFRVGTMTLPEMVSKIVRHDWGIVEHQFEAGSKPISEDAWRRLLGQWKSEYRLRESEWHQEAFRANENGRAVSIYRIVLHAERLNAPGRLVVRATLKIIWENGLATEEARPHGIEVEQLKILTPEDSVPFRHERDFELARDLPDHKPVHPSGARDVLAAPLLVQDLDGDHLPEVVLAGANLVYRNRGNFKFQPEPLVPGSRYSFQAGVLADFNGDGYSDLLTLGPAGKPRLYPGTKSGFLKNEPLVSLANIQAVSIRDPQCITCGDVDGDGDLDAFIGQYASTYMSGKLPTPYYDANDGHPAYLLINDGTGRFADQTEAFGLALKRNRRTYSASFVDLDEDRDLDLMVVSDFAGLDLYRNNGKGQFTDITDSLGANHYSFGMSHALADFDQDQKLDIYMVGMGSTTARRLESLGLGRPGFENIQQARMKMGYGNRLLLGQGGLAYRQPDYNDRLARTGWAWGCTPWDFDNDGDRDLYVANGFLSAKSARDYCTQYWRHDIYYNKKRPETLMQMVFTECQSGVGSEVSWNGYEHNVLLMNSPDRQFPNVSYLLGLGFEFDSRSVVSADLNLDGRPDLLVVERARDEERKMYVNRVHLLGNHLKTGHNWVGVHLPFEAATVGAQVVVKSGKHRQVLPVVTGDSYNSQHAFTVHFGLGKASAVDEILVQRANGKVTRLENPAINQFHAVSVKNDQ